jgi:hypothetical protein
MHIHIIIMSLSSIVDRRTYFELQGTISTLVFAAAMAPLIVPFVVVPFLSLSPIVDDDLFFLNFDFFRNRLLTGFFGQLRVFGLGCSLILAMIGFLKEIKVKSTQGFDFDVYL